MDINHEKKHVNGRMSPKEYEKLVNALKICNAHRDFLTAWEKEFVDNIGRLDIHALTPVQQKTLKDLGGKIRRFTVGYDKNSRYVKPYKRWYKTKKDRKPRHPKNNKMPEDRLDFILKYQSVLSDWNLKFANDLAKRRGRYISDKQLETLQRIYYTVLKASRLGNDMKLET
jgi:hypothetical protein